MTAPQASPQPASPKSPLEPALRDYIQLITILVAFLEATAQQLSPSEPFPLRCERQTGQHILMAELGEVLQKFGFTGASCQDPQHISHGQPSPPHTGLTEPHSWIDGDSLKVVHLLTLGPTPELLTVELLNPGHPTKKPQLPPGPQSLSRSRLHPFSPRRSQKAAPWRQRARPVVCS